MAELRQEAAVSYFSCVCQASEKMADEIFQTPQRYSHNNTRNVETPEMENSFAGLQERLVRSLSDSDYEVRLATLKWLLKFVTSTESGNESHDNNSEIRVIQHWVRTNLQTTLVNLLDVEKYHKCSYYVLRNLFTWNTLQFQKFGDAKCTETIYVGSMECDSVFLLWDKLISLYKVTRHAKARQILICCFGICVKQFAFAKDRIAKLGGADWVGGAGNHKDAFLPLYANLLAFHALSNYMFNGKTGDNKHLLSDAAQIGKAINPFLRNPLISNLYLLVVKSHEDAVGSNGDGVIPKLGEDAIWDGFNPHVLRS